MKEYPISTFEEAVQVIKEVGILPLASLVPDHPSLVSITPEENWHTATESDPWSWRTKFAAEGYAAYGKFFKKKAVFISTELFPLVRAVLGSTRSINERYQDGLVSQAAQQLFNLISEEEGIDTRLLRRKAGLKAKEQKKTYDQGINELQGSLDIVIAGVKEKRNELGEINGWNSTSFQTADYWMKDTGIQKSTLGKEEAKERLFAHLEGVCSPKAVIFFRKMI